MIRTLAMIGGLAGAVALSQFPEFTQQYVQRLSGARTELKVITTGFDLTAKAAGYSRDEALDKMSGSDFQNDLRDQMQDNFNRYDRLDASYAALKGTEPLMRLTKLWHFRDADLVERTWNDYRPAVPVTADGILCAGIGYVGGWLIVSLLLGAFLRPFRKLA
ncbi:Protein of unknown function [Aliiroseovarius halocynthiae]|uniref:DUF2937 family protein n=1 Tax=Aliiroseovarius halocynthiae TaxID=985055 RepID=A0A545SM54_9RHOB|nr:DUF2937 family protein [Aliiroseovarius halocynthiae]TQV66058.1 DUF2937 family protein [Aliiroseovarius halocynthiae]SMR83234.1 Protein of unknown function [Aliiroseovarius halocynthiae]